MFTTPEHRTIVAMLAEGSPVWYVAAVTKSDRHQAYAVGARYGYPDREALKRSLQEPTGAGRLLASGSVSGSMTTQALAPFSQPLDPSRAQHPPPLDPPVDPWSKSEPIVPGRSPVDPSG